MSQTKKQAKRELYDIKEYGDKVRHALENLEKTQRPGEMQGRGGKVEVLSTVKEEIKAMMDKGYTAQQIAAAITESDVFKILPKTLTEIAGKRATKRTPRKQPAYTGQDAGNKTGNTSSKDKPASTGDKASIVVKPDSGKDHLTDRAGRAKLSLGITK